MSGWVGGWVCGQMDGWMDGWNLFGLDTYQNLERVLHLISPCPSVIEKFTENTRFCLICNYLSKIIPALQSRCTRFRFGPLSHDQMISRLEYIIQQEWYSFLIKPLCSEEQHAHSSICYTCAYSVNIVSVPDPRSGGGSGELAYMNCLWDTLPYTGFLSDN